MERRLFRDVDINFLREFIEEIADVELSDDALFEEDDDQLGEIVDALQHPDASQSDQKAIIDDFLKCRNLRIELNEQLVIDDDASELETVQITTSNQPDLNGLSEALAKIYLDQELYSRAIDIYRQLSLLNSEKSVYFAELIEEVRRIRSEKQRDN